MPDLQATVIIPFHRNLSQLAQSLPAARRSLPDAEILVVLDGAIEDCASLIASAGAHTVTVPDGPRGPAVARNVAASKATGDVIVFVDADVVPAADALSGMCRFLESNPDVAAVFGAYDHDPAEKNFMSQYKNLSHACVHEMGNPEAGTFWAGLGAIRTAVFRSVAGFDERFVRPSIEDIELGYRMRSAGHRIRLDVRFRGTHLKRWTLVNSVVTDIRARGVPWTQLIHRSGGPANDLNTRKELRLSIVLAYVSVISIALTLLTPLSLVAAGMASAALLLLNQSYYRWFVARRGWAFAARVVPAHVLYHLCNGASFGIGTVLYLGTKAGLRFQSALPLTSWNR